MARKRKLEKDFRNPLEYGLDILAGRWSSRIIGALSGGEAKRYGELKALVEGVSDTSLSLVLQELEAAEMIVRNASEEGNRTIVEYRLTEKGLGAVPLLRGICAWAARYHPATTESCLDKCKGCPTYRSATFGGDDA